ncbi:MAG: D-alanyl-D-alanine carboxypeptidase [Bacilli bacterium]|nr:D-alanyl-D-alanine carboxypeptidase [Bacilli bacterium]
MKKIKILLLILVILPFKVNAIELNISSKNAILYNIDSNEILYKKDSDSKVQIASLTKIMTALVALENIQDIDKQIIITKEDFKGVTEANLVTAGFTVGETVTYRDLLYGLLLPSGADAAKALVRNTTNTEEEFIKLMNKKVEELKLKNTHFNNTIGIDDDNNYSTAEDILTVFKEALKNEEFSKMIKTKEYKTTDGKIVLKSTIQKNAKTFNIEVPYIMGGKTGTTSGAGLCLATVAKEKDVNYILITLGALYDKKAPHHIEDAKTIYDYFIENYSNIKIIDKNKSFKTLKTKYAKEEKIKICPSKDVIKYLPNNYNKEDVKIKYKGIEEITPFTKEKIGKINIYYKDKLIDTQKIYLKEKIHLSIINILKENILIIIILILLAIIIKRAIF